ncbi:hypothetical protein PVA45_01140 [Entomospira entomophila]|uniref:GRAM domain-containing protein n=1 Tax=Entomospira entomophila TaxID=2719988 RepID=A0A968KQT8_9SPIO|nr:hypothetical protein [Entomospira entomophilus]NIZ40124.1 hypothetical protein [Entomospira entomophilus]WDI35683.1 hypothetical protein PVA45_01140 [Entomospira entomophilus]
MQYTQTLRYWLIKNEYLHKRFLNNPLHSTLKFFILILIIAQIILFMRDSSLLPSRILTTILTITLLQRFFLWILIRTSHFRTYQTNLIKQLSHISIIHPKIPLLPNEKCYFSTPAMLYEPRVIKNYVNLKATNRRRAYGSRPSNSSNSDTMNVDYTPTMKGSFYLTNQRLVFISHDNKASSNPRPTVTYVPTSFYLTNERLSSLTKSEQPKIKEINISDLFDCTIHIDGIFPITNQSRSPFIELSLHEALQVFCILKHIKPDLQI